MDTKTFIPAKELGAIVVLLESHSLTAVAKQYGVSHANVLRGFLVKHGIDPNRYKHKPGPKAVKRVSHVFIATQVRPWPVFSDFSLDNLLVRD